MSSDYICEFCQWRGYVELGQEICPHCQEEGHFMPVEEWVIPTERPENNQVIYTVVQELDNDTPEIKES